MRRSGAMKRLNVRLSASPVWVLKNFNSPAWYASMSIASILARQHVDMDEEVGARGDDGTHAHNTLSADNTDVQVFYPFHPLHGVVLRVLRRPERGAGAVCVMDPAGRRLKIPIWMLLPECAEITISQRPHLGKQALLSL